MSQRTGRAGRRCALVLGVVMAAFAVAAGAQGAVAAGTLLCTPVEGGAAEGLYRCAPAAAVGGEIVVTGEATNLFLLPSEFEALRQQVATLQLLLGAIAESSAEWTAGEHPAPSAADEPRPTNDLLWRALEEEQVSPPDPDDGPEEEAAHSLSLLDVNIGGGDGGSATVGLSGRYFRRFGEQRAVQAEGSFLYYDERQELELDLGLVQRIGDLQLGVFAGVKHLGFRDFDDAATLTQAALTADWVFARGRLGLFGAAGVSDSDVVERRLVRRNFELLTAVSVVDQLGVSGRYELSGPSRSSSERPPPYVEGNAAYLVAAESRESGGLLRFVYPLNPRWAITAEGGWNDGLVSPASDEMRFVIGLRTGRWHVPPEPEAGKASPAPDAGEEAGEAEDSQPDEAERPAAVVPVEIPRLRYELRSRERRLGNDFPIADAGPDQRLTADCRAPTCPVEVLLDGSGSFDPDGDPLTYSWTPRAGFDAGETIRNADRPTASFTAREGGRYVIRLTVSDGEGSGFDEVEVTVERRPEVKILRLRALPEWIRPGETAIIEWKVRNATRVTLKAGPDGVPQPVAVDIGTLAVSPNHTTVYTLEASNALSRDLRSVTVTVKATPPS